jgi:hypothetical protein
MDQRTGSLYLSKPKQTSRQIEKAALWSFRSIRAPSKPKGLVSLVLLSEGGRRSIQSLINGA